MKAAVIDTNVLIDCFRSGDRSSAVEEYDRILLSPVVLGEFRAGIDASTKHGRRAQRQLDEFIDDPAVVIVPCTEDTAEYYAKVYQVLKKSGTPIPTNDIWIASTALEHGAEVLSADGHFACIPMLKTHCVR